MIGKEFRCDAPFELVSIYFYKYYATLLLYLTSVAAISNVGYLRSFQRCVAPTPFIENQNRRVLKARSTVTAYVLFAFIRWRRSYAP